MRVKLANEHYRLSFIVYIRNQSEICLANYEESLIICILQAVLSRTTCVQKFYNTEVSVKYFVYRVALSTRACQIATFFRSDETFRRIYHFEGLVRSRLANTDGQYHT